ncbi:MAG TPA: TetR/AcrR family transcriptional regulator [Mycobacteriales bacterium]
MPDIRHFDEAAAIERAELLFWRDGVRAVGVAQLSSATGLSRSSLYNAFGDKHGLYIAAVDRYLTKRAIPSFARLENAPDGLAGIQRFFDELIAARCGGPYRGWGCLIVNGSAELADSDREAGIRFNRHADALRNAFTAALTRARSVGAIRPDTVVQSQSELLTLLAYGLTVRSRAGEQGQRLHDAVSAALDPMTTPQSGRDR